MRWTPLCANTNDVNNTRALLQTIGAKDEPCHSLTISKEKKELWQIVPPLIQVWHIFQKTSDQLIDISPNQWLIYWILLPPFWQYAMDSEHLID